MSNHVTDTCLISFSNQMRHFIVYAFVCYVPTVIIYLNTWFLIPVALLIRASVCANRLNSFLKLYFGNTCTKVLLYGVICCNISLHPLVMCIVFCNFCILFFGYLYENTHLYGGQVKSIYLKYMLHLKGLAHTFRQNKLVEVRK
jgi:hypothetical protein